MRRFFLCFLLLACFLPASPTAQAAAVPQADAVPLSFDWRSAGMVTPVREQGLCAAGRAFAAAAMLESAILIAGGPRVDLSEQFLINCAGQTGVCSGAGGWEILDAYQDAVLAPNTLPGAVLESAVPYRAKPAACTRAAAHPYRIERWQLLAPGLASVEQIQRAVLDYGPVAIGICVGPAFNNYSAGVFAIDEAGPCELAGFHTNHTVTVVGWNGLSGAWIVKNSFGTDWGEQGYMRIAYEISNAGYDGAYLVYAAPPAAPRGMTPAAGALLPLTDARLAWLPVPGADSYQAQVATDALFTNMLQDTSIDSTWLEPAGLPANRLLWWRVSACRVVEVLPRCSAWSAPRSFKTRPGAPSLTFPPADALVENLTPGFTWLQADDAARFELQIAADAAFSRLVRRGMTTVPLYYPGSELPRDQVFYWRVRAAGRYGLGAWSAGQAFHTPLQPADRPLR